MTVNSVGAVLAIVVFILAVVLVALSVAVGFVVQPVFLLILVAALAVARLT